MKWLILLLIISVKSFGQVSFRTVVPQQPVVAGQSFQVQYILENATGSPYLENPDFRYFRFITGPNIYPGTSKHGSKIVSIINYVFTLEARQVGKFFIPGAIVTVNNKKLRSNDAVIAVVSANDNAVHSDPGASEYVLRPGENPMQKISRNMFLKLQVDRKKCLVGQPVVATFKLYSRLESKSDITKNPGFYGFTVYDMINLNDQVASVETINGKPFDVHTIRKVQLYPLQPGRYTIDAMEVHNQVEFSKSTVYKKTEQEIIEGIVDKGFETSPKEGTEIFETSLSTDPVTIEVSALPEKNQPAGFNGAVGLFKIESSIDSQSFKTNEVGKLVVTINGKGNFTQIGPPQIDWPVHIESFQPVSKEELDKTTVPLKGSRSFVFPFVSLKPGNYTLPAINFSFFDPDSGKYKTVSTGSLQFEISQQAANLFPVKEKAKARINYTWVALAVVVIAGLVILSIYNRRP